MTRREEILMRKLMAGLSVIVPICQREGLDKTGSLAAFKRDIQAEYEEIIKPGTRIRV